MTPIAFALLLVTPWWSFVGFLIAGWFGTGIALMVMGLLLILAHEMKPRPPRFRGYAEEVIGTVEQRRLRLKRAEWRRQVAWRAEQRRAA